ncbi:MAG: peptide deformylase [Candidatus Stahlbacteria bacterium]|nr:peptide deformylase [Candidatus Stahlbacteria bacterium]
MNRLRIYPDPALRTNAKRVEDFDTRRLDYIIGMMEKIIKEHKAAGLAANQIGVIEQIIIISVEEEIILINPEIIEYKGKETKEEGCISLPETDVEIERSTFVVVKGVDERGERKIIEANDLVARALLHEIDHLNGVLIIDKLSPIKRVQFDMQWKRGENEKGNSSRVF